MENTFSYTDAQDLIQCILPDFDNGEKIVCVSVPEVSDSFFKSVDAQAIIRDVLKANNLRFWVFFTLSFSTENRFMFVFIKKSVVSND